MDLITWLNQNAAGLGVLVALIAVVLPSAVSLWRYVDLKRREIQQARFDSYHRLIRGLTQPESPGEEMRLDRQIAIVFELRNFPEYFELTTRLLEGLRATWQPAGQNRLIDEIDHTIGYIARKTKPLSMRPHQDHSE